MEPMTTRSDAQSLADIFQILKRRKRSLVLPAVLIFLAAAAVALLLPPVYSSTSTILIEEQEIPVEFVRATVTSYAEERIQMINQRVMSFSRLSELVNRLNLYPDLRNSWTTEQIVTKMRDDIRVEPVSAEVKDPRTGRPTNATIAFNLSYEGKDPGTVQQVANTLTSLYLEENLKVREQQAKETTQFLEDEMNQLKRRLAELESSIASFKEKHLNELPELMQATILSVERMERESERLVDQMRSLKEREGYLQTQLASIPPEFGNEDKKRIEELKLQLVNLRTRVSDEYPDVIKLKREIAELEKARETAPAVAGAPTLQKAAVVTDRSDNPAYVTLASQLASTQIEIESVKRLNQEVRAKLDQYRKRIEATPQVERSYKTLLVERDNTQVKYNDLMAKHMEAKVAHGLEKEQKGERFTLIDPPRLPEEPVKPNRLAIMLIGIVLGIGGGVGFAALREYSDQSVRSAESLTLATSFPVLAGIPEIETARDRTRKHIRAAIAVLILIAALIAAVAAFHYFVMDLDVFWAKLARRAGHMGL